MFVRKAVPNVVIYHEQSNCIASDALFHVKTVKNDQILVNFHVCKGSSAKSSHLS
jgi:hypothetical protein